MEIEYPRWRVPTSQALKAVYKTAIYFRENNTNKIHSIKGVTIAFPYLSDTKPIEDNKMIDLVIEPVMRCIEMTVRLTGRVVYNKAGTSRSKTDVSGQKWIKVPLRAALQIIGSFLETAINYWFGHLFFLLVAYWPLLVVMQVLSLVSKASGWNPMVWVSVDASSYAFDTHRRALAETLQTNRIILSRLPSDASQTTSFATSLGISDPTPPSSRCNSPSSVAGVKRPYDEVDTQISGSKQPPVFARISRMA